MDELRDAEGEPCLVTDLRTGERHAGTVVSVEGARVVVRYDTGELMRVGYSFVQLVNPETP